MGCHPIVTLPALPQGRAAGPHSGAFHRLRALGLIIRVAGGAAGKPACFERGSLSSVSYARDRDDAPVNRRRSQARSSTVSAPVAITSIGNASSSAAFTATAGTNASGDQSDAA